MRKGEAGGDMFVFHPRNLARAASISCGGFAIIPEKMSVERVYSQDRADERARHVPLFVIDEAIERIMDGTIVGCAYDPRTAWLGLALRSGSHCDPLTTGGTAAFGINHAAQIVGYGEGGN
jgi:hypothetical protein